MKKFLFVLCILMIMVGCSKSNNVSSEINNNLSSSNPNISAKGATVDESGNQVLKEFHITSDSFNDITKADNPELLDDETYYEQTKEYTEWLVPQYDEMIDEITSAKFKVIDYIDGTDGLLLVLENEDNGYMLYIYDNNRVKIINGNDTNSYELDGDLSYSYSLLDGLYQKISDFNTNLREKSKWDEENENL